MLDGREVSVFWGGAENPDGTRKKKELPEQAKGKRKAARGKQAAAKAKVRGRWVKQKVTLETRTQWHGSRCFDKWLLQQSQRTYASRRAGKGRSNGDATGMPLLCCVC